MNKFLACCIFFLPLSINAQMKETYSIFTGEGKSISYQKMIQSLEKADVVFFGELHNNTLAHWLELQVLKDLYASKRTVTLGMEMFESDDQIIINEYLHRMIEEKQLLAEAKIWDNYKTDYKPLVEFARKNQIQLIATNIPRRYANMVYRKGLPSLDSIHIDSKKWIAPLPLEVDYSLSSYKAMMEGMGQHGDGSARNLVTSQALKDATMAHFISINLMNEGIFYHVNGAYHSQDHQGIITYLSKLNPKLKVVTLHVTEQSSLDQLEDRNLRKGDFVFCIVDDMIKSY